MWGELTTYLWIGLTCSGDIFSCHAVDNPKPQAELAMLRQYGPQVPEATLQKLVAAFGELRSMADQGTITYPYSTREVVNIVKHLQVNTTRKCARSGTRVSVPRRVLSPSQTALRRGDAIFLYVCIHLATKYSRATYTLYGLPYRLQHFDCTCFGVRLKYDPKFSVGGL